jgi:hypothetical protein
LAFYKIKRRGGKKLCFSPVLRAPRQAFFPPPNDKINDKIKKNFKKWEAPAE